MYLGRLLGVEQFGVYSFVISWVIILSLFSSFGFEHMQVRYVAAYKAKGELRNLLSLINSGHTFVLTLGAFTAVVILGVLYFYRESVSEGVFYAYFLGATIIPVLALINSNNGVLRGFKKQLHVSILFEVLRPLILLIFVFILMQFSFDISVSRIMGLMMGSTVLIFLLSMYWVIIYRDSETVGMADIARENQFSFTSTTIDWSIKAVPFMFFAAIMQIEKNTDILMLGLYGDMASVGIYAVAVKITTILLLVTITLNTVASPHFSELFTLGKISQLSKLVSIVAKVSSIIAFFVLLLIYYYGETIISLFGDEFKGSTDVLKVLAFAHFLKTLAGPVLMISVMTGYQKIALKVIAFGATIHIALNFIFIPYWGAVGAAYSASLSIILWSYLLSYLIYKEIGFNPSVFPTLKNEVM